MVLLNIQKSNTNMYRYFCSTSLLSDLKIYTFFFKRIYVIIFGLTRFGIDEARRGTCLVFGG